jgi:hypothetical protein
MLRESQVSAPVLLSIFVPIIVLENFHWTRLTVTGDLSPL